MKYVYQIISICITIQIVACGPPKNKTAKKYPPNGEETVKATIPERNKVDSSQRLLTRDGNNLYQVYCKACHHPIKNGIGPKLQGVRKKWIDSTQTSSVIYTWMANKDSVSGHKDFIDHVEQYSPNHVCKDFGFSRDTLDAILDYCELLHHY